ATNSTRLDRTDANVADNSARISQVSSEVGALRDDSFKGIAATAALAVMMTPSAPGKTAVNFGASTYKSESALGLNLTHRVGYESLAVHNVTINAGVSMAGTDNVVLRGGFGFEF
ncbi:MAG: hypothetical protein GY801_52645, partial [bacterium]|nr:hypothetical protein [bacterium]